MAKCVECGAEQPRENMFGLGEELRCSNCAQRGRQKFSGRPLRYVAGRYHITLAFVIIAIIFSVTHWQAPDISVRYLIDQPVAIWNGQLWRFLSSALVHASLLHLLFNLSIFWRLGGVIESWLGPIRYLGFLIILAVSTNAAQFLWSGSCVGLSGVVYAQFGLLVALRHYKSFAAAEIQPGFAQVMFGWLIACNFLGLPVANVAHVSGLVFGWVLGWLTRRKQRVLFVSVFLVFLALLPLATLYMPWDRSYMVYRLKLAIAYGRDDEAKYWNERLAKTMQRLNAIKRLPIGVEKDKPAVDQDNE